MPLRAERGKRSRLHARLTSRGNCRGIDARTRSCGALNTIATRTEIDGPCRLWRSTEIVPSATPAQNAASLGFFLFSGLLAVF
jgi:hypothetical protein